MFFLFFLIIFSNVLKTTTIIFLLHLHYREFVIRAKHKKTNQTKSVMSSAVETSHAGSSGRKATDSSTSFPPLPNPPQRGGLSFPSFGGGVRGGKIALSLRSAQ